MKKVTSAAAKPQLTNGEIQDLCNVYSKIISLQDQIGVFEDLHFDNQTIRSELFKCYNNLESARKRLSKYCEEYYE